MQFVDFCRIHGVSIDHLPPVGVWKRYPTEDHPRSRNGAVKWMGDHGFVQNHATMLDVAVWQPESHEVVKVDHEAIARRASEAQRSIHQGREKAAKLASEIISSSRQGTHPYLEKKGYPEECGLVWKDGDASRLVIPMRVGRDVVGVQLIGEDGKKKFLPGQRTSDASFVIGDTKRAPIFCEGYATALSIRSALMACKMAGCIVVCFSAHNVPKLAARIPGGVVVADNDESGTGERVAMQTGLPWWMPPTVGHDANDCHQSKGLFFLAMELKRLMMAKKAGRI